MRVWEITSCPDCDLAGFVPDHGHRPPDLIQVVPLSELEEAQEEIRALEDELAGEDL